jgi:hypothetical protein
MLGIDAWVVFGVLLVGGYAYWVYTDLVRPWLAADEPYEWAEPAEDVEEPSEPDRPGPPEEE